DFRFLRSGNRLGCFNGIRFLRSFHNRRRRRRRRPLLLFKCGGGRLRYLVANDNALAPFFRRRTTLWKRKWPHAGRRLNWSDRPRRNIRARRNWLRWFRCRRLAERFEKFPNPVFIRFFRFARQRASRLRWRCRSSVPISRRPASFGCDSGQDLKKNRDRDEEEKKQTNEIHRQHFFIFL